MSESEGLAVLAKTLKDVAVNRVDPKHRRYPHAENEDYGNQVYRVADINASKCWYGFNYLRNDSQYSIKELVSPELTGFEVVGKDEPYCNQANAGEDDIMILRRT